MTRMPLASPDRTDVDDASFVRLQHRPDDRLAAVKASAEIHREDPLQCLRRHILKLLIPGDAGVVDQQTDMAQFLLNLPDHRVYLRPVGYIGLQTHGHALLLPQLCHQSLGLFPLLQIVDANGIAAPCQQGGNGRADPPRGTGYQGNVLHASFASLRSRFC